MVRKSQTPRRKPKQPSRPQDRLDLEALAAEQGVQPLGNPNDLVADFWPEDETADDFVQAVRQWRKEGQRRPAL